MVKRKYVFIGFLAFCLVAPLLAGVPTIGSLNQSGGKIQATQPYDPWCDVSCDGVINIVDIVNLGLRFDTTGTPLSHAAVQFEGNISVPAAAFVPNYNTHEARNDGWELYNYDGMGRFFFAQVQLPHGATITKLTFYWYDNGTENIFCALQNYHQDTHDTMVSLYSSGSAGHGVSSTTVILHPTVDNNQYAYLMRVMIPYSASHVDYYFELALIEFEY